MSLDWLGKVVSAFDGDDDQDDDDSYEQSGNTQPQSSAYGQTDIKVAVKLEPNVDNAYTFDVHTPACVNTPAEAAAAPCTSSVGQSFLLPPFKLATHNVVAAAQVTCHVDAREFATCTGNTIVNDTRSCVEKQVRRPTAHVKVFTSGKMTVYGCRTPQAAYITLRRAARAVQRMMHRAHHARAHLVRMCNYRVCNVMASTRLPFEIDLLALHEAQKPITEFEPELTTGLVWRVRVEGLRATLRVQHTGSIVVTGANSCAMARACVEHVLPILVRYAVTSIDVPSTLAAEHSANMRTVRNDRLRLAKLAQARMYRVEEERFSSSSDTEANDNLEAIEQSRLKHRLSKEAAMYTVEDIKPDVKHPDTDVKPTATATAPPRAKRSKLVPSANVKLQPVQMIDERELDSDDDSDFEDV